MRQFLLGKHPISVEFGSQEVFLICLPVHLGLFALLQGVSKQFGVFWKKKRKIIHCG